VYRFEPNLRIPGPTHLPPQVREAGGRQMINHRGPEFAALMDRIDRGMRAFFGTQQPVMLLTAAGTGGLEAAIVNALSPADRVLAVPTGAFGDRFAKIATVYGADVTRLDTEWGRAADPAILRARLSKDNAFKAVLLTHNETSTGVTNPIPELAAVVHELAPHALILVDAISALGAVPFEMDAWGLDVVITGSQKAWMAAPGMTMLALSERGWAAAEEAKMPRVYFDLREAKKTAANGQTPWTPAVAVMYQVDAGLALMGVETPAGVFARHHACAEATRAGLRALGFELLADAAFASDTVTAAWIPEDLDWKAFNAGIKERFVVLAGGQGKLKGKIFRVGHLGAVSIDDILGAIGAMEEVAIEMGRPLEPGAAVAAAAAAARDAKTAKASATAIAAAVPA
jgi:aspartate aminotransferase-like enzyme